MSARDRDAAPRRRALQAVAGDHQEDPAEIEKMAAAGAVHARTLKLLEGKIRAGRHDRASSTRPPSATSARRARVPSFKGYRGFPGSICASPNAMVVHGIPGPYRARATATSSRSTSA